MDEWVDEDQFVGEKDMPVIKDFLEEHNEGPMTRNQRRRFNDGAIPVHAYYKQ
jgi:hypothetical protein